MENRLCRLNHLGDLEFVLNALTRLHRQLSPLGFDIKVLQKPIGIPIEKGWEVTIHFWHKDIQQSADFRVWHEPEHGVLFSIHDPLPGGKTESDVIPESRLLEVLLHLLSEESYDQRTLKLREEELVVLRGAVACRQAALDALTRLVNSKE